MAFQEDRARRDSHTQLDRDMAAVFIFSNDFTEVLTLYASRFRNRKFPGGRQDIASGETIFETALRELNEETRITPSDLVVFNDGGIESPLIQLSFSDPSRSKKRYYYVGVLQDPKKKVESFKTEEDDPGKYVSEQELEPLSLVLMDSERLYNTVYLVALAKALIEMQSMPQFEHNRDLADVINYDLGVKGIFLKETLLSFETRVEKENTARTHERDFNRALRERALLEK